MKNTSSLSKIFSLRTAVVLAILFSSESCIITNTPGFYSGYKKLNSEQICQIKPFGAEEKSVVERAEYISINGKQLHALLNHFDNAIVYIWSPHCHTEVCYPLSFVQNYCDKNGYKLFVVVEYYDFEKAKTSNPDHIQLYSIEHKFYKTDYVPRYTKRFVSDLVGKKMKIWPRQMFFVKGQFVGSTLLIK